jgi:hypothetical protein
MSIFNFFKKPHKEGKSQIAQEIDRFIETQKNEIENIENFFEILSPYQNPETLLMTLKEFIEYLEEQTKPIREDIIIETNPSKINDLNNELTNIDLLKSYIYTYINSSKSKFYDLPEIKEEATTLSQLRSILEEREEKIKEILNLNTK